MPTAQQEQRTVNVVKAIHLFLYTSFAQGYIFMVVIRPLLSCVRTAGAALVHSMAIITNR